MTSLAGRARVFGADINTDYIITSRRKRESLDPQYLRRYLFEEIAPEFAATIQPGDLIVAGSNFGCGSAMEVAVTAVVGAGIRAVLAPSFSRTYFRNAVNNGLLPLECDTAAIAEGAHLEISLGASPHVTGIDSGATVTAAPLPPFVLAIFAAGGIVPYLKLHGGFPPSL